MLKILPIINNYQNYNFFKRSRKNIVSSSILTLSLLSSFMVNSCAKSLIEPDEDYFEKNDSISKNEKNDERSNFEITIDSMSNKEYEYYF